MTRYKPLVLPLMLILLHTQLIIVPSSSAATYANHTGALPPAVVPCLPDQASALLRLKRSFSITKNSSSTFRSWKAGTDCCHWEGIHCRNGDGRVTSLDLGGRRLESGGLDPAIFHLTSLNHLNLACNSFNGSQLPQTGFERLTMLTYLNLSSSDFVGQVPTASISRLTNLVSLDLSTRFEVEEFTQGHSVLSFDSVESSVLKEPNFETLIANHKKLRELYLGAVDLSDNGMTWCDALSSSTPNLRVLSLPNCGSLVLFVDPFLPCTRLLLLTYGLMICLVPFQTSPPSPLCVFYDWDTIFFKDSFYGEIPSSIGNLKYLKNLGVGASQFSGELPSSIGWLKSLNSLEISGTTIVGTIPSWITNLTSLTILQFSRCGLTGSIPSFLGKLPQHISNFTNLSTLFLNSNNLVGTMKLTSLWGLQHLRYLDISDNNLVVVDGKVNSSSTHIPKLQILALSGCNITKFPDFLRSQDELLWLDLSKNQIHGAIPSWAWESWNDAGIDSLILAHNKFTSVGSNPFIPLQMDWLDLSNNMFEGTIPIPQGSARLLDYSNNKFSSIPFNFTAHLSHVTLFNAPGNNFSGEIPPSFCTATELQYLDLSNNFSGSIPSCLIENVNGIQILNLNANQLDGEIPDTIKEGCSFHALYFSGNRIEGQLPRSLLACQNLEILDAGNNQINDIFPCWMSKLRRLQVLVLKSNKLFGHVVQSLTDEESTCAFPNAIIIDISSNNFSGPLPKDKWFKKLEPMLHIDTNTSLVMDHAVPSHPRNCWELVLIHGINMSHNFLTGPIPSQLGGLKQLEALDLSSNQLSGVIPQELASLDFLEMLNLSYNKLEGKIPESLHFSTFTNSSFLGNNDLCGPPLSKGCINMTILNVIPSKKKSVDIVLFLFSGLGFGLGLAIAVVVSWGIPIRKQATVTLAY
uniref:non-specific serine/threonine protein kinase n=1 Tax=Oryza meridionalis TaxID=40149 RepID=A0A0E0BXM4_9ORYZ